MSNQTVQYAYLTGQTFWQNVAITIILNAYYNGTKEILIALYARKAILTKYSFFVEDAVKDFWDLIWK